VEDRNDAWSTANPLIRISKVKYVNARHITSISDGDYETAYICLTDGSTHKVAKEYLPSVLNTLQISFDKE